MKHKSELKAYGSLHLVLKDQHGNVKQEEFEDNIIVATGLAHIVSRMQGTVQAAMGWLAVGTGTTAENIDHTALVTEIARVATSVSTVTTVKTNDTVQHIATLAAGVGTGALTEAGLFNVVTANSGTMLNRVLYAVINKGALDSLVITWKVRIV